MPRRVAKKKKKPSRKKSRKKNNNFFARCGKWVVANCGYLLLIAAIIIMGFQINRYVHTHASFDVSSIVSSPIDAMPHAMVVQVAGLHTGKNIFDYDLADVAWRLEQLTRIKSAEVYRLFPNTIRIDVIERKPCAILKVPFTKNQYVIDDEGYVIDTVATATERSLPVIDLEVVSSKRIVLGSPYEQKNVLSFISFFKKIKTDAPIFFDNVDQVLVDKGYNVSMEYTDGLIINFGKDPETRISRLRLVEKIFESTPRERMYYIDLRYDDILTKERK